MSDRNTVPQPTAADHAHAAGRAVVGGVLGVIPGAGSILSAAAVELYGMVLTPPIELRRMEFLQSLADRILALEAAGKLTRDSLLTNDGFHTAVLQATQAATRTHHAEKREALRNAAVNAAFPDAPAESQQQMFLRWVEDLTPWHIRLLRFAQDPEGYLRAADKQPPDFGFSSSIMQVIEMAFPTDRPNDDLLQLLADDLKARGLADISSMKTMMSANGWRGSRTKPLGNEFLMFISLAPDRQV